MVDHAGMDHAPSSDRYEVGREIARGGMGLVFEARHRVTRRRVALKVVLEGQHSAEATLRLHREAALLGELADHPAIVGVLDAGALTDGGAYVAMELLEGRPLEGILVARQRLGIEEVSRIGTLIADALAFAHRHRIVHRDIKPANILVTPRPDRTESVKLIDFGVACSLDEASGNPRITQAGDFLGTLEYVAPEQLADASKPDPRSDIYSLGVVLYECVMGVLPALPHRMKNSPDIDAMAAERKDAPRALLQAIVRAMQPDPENRFQSASEFVEALSEANETRPVQILAGAEVQRAHQPSAERVSQRRRFLRAPYLAPCRVSDAAGGKWDGRTEDISEGGVLLLVHSTKENRIFDQGDRVVLRFALPGSGRVVAAESLVRWVKISRERIVVGLEFDPELDVAARGAISAYTKFFSAGEGTG